jgi:hypothetical protein
MRKAIPFFAVGVVAVGLWVTVLFSQQTDPLETIMGQKLGYAHNLLEALILEDFGAIERNSEQLRRLSRASNWNVIRTYEFTRHNSEFRRAIDALLQAAQEKSLDGAAQSYVELTLQCIRCHQYLRNVGRAGLD